MDSDTIFVRPSEVFASPSTKSPVFPQVWEPDERFRQYDSSPESTSSLDDNHVFSPFECQTSHGKLLLDTIRQSLYTHPDLLATNTPSIPLDTFDESLLSTFMTDYLHQRYGLLPRLQPHPMAASLAIAMSHPACLHIMTAHAAQYAIFKHDSHSPLELRQLEVALTGHRGEALQILSNANVEASQTNMSEPWMASIFALGLLDAYSAGENTATIHFKAARNILHPTGDPLVVLSPWLTRVVAYFDCGFQGTASLIWDKPDFSRLHMDLNAFLGKLWCFQRPAAPRPRHIRRGSAHQLPARVRIVHPSLPILQPNSVLLDCLSRRPFDATNPTQRDRHELVFQLISLLMLSNIMTDYQSDPQTLQSQLASVHDMIAAAQLQGQSCNNTMWLIAVTDQSDAHTARIWAAMGRVWILRHVSFNVQNMVKDWLLAVMTGRPVMRSLKLDSFAFSYAS